LLAVPQTYNITARADTGSFSERVSMFTQALDTPKMDEAQRMPHLIDKKIHWNPNRFHKLLKPRLAL
jgi:hypothetical protein